MPANKRTLYLLAYDIADPKRLTKVHRTVREYGAPLQYSVFLIPANAAVIDELLALLKDIIKPSLDDIRVYPLPTRLDLVRYGRQWLPEGVQIVGDDLVERAFAVLAQQAAKD